MSDVLLVLNPRRIEECLAAIRALDIDKIWIRNLAERQVEARWPEVLELAAGYDRALIVSDDCVPHQPALDHVRGLLDDGHEVASGYCNLGADDMRVNLCPLPYPDVHVHMTLAEAQSWPGEVIPTSFVGFALTGMSVEMWARYPYRTTGGGWGADQTLCERLADDGVPVVAHRSAFVWHVKETWSRMDAEPRKRLLVGVEPAVIELEAAGVAV